MLERPTRGRNVSSAFEEMWHLIFVLFIKISFFEGVEAYWCWGYNYMKFSIISVYRIHASQPIYTIWWEDMIIATLQARPSPKTVLNRKCSQVSRRESCISHHSNFKKIKQPSRYTAIMVPNYPLHEQEFTIGEKPKRLNCATDQHICDTE